MHSLNDIKIHQRDYLFKKENRERLEQYLNAQFLLDIDQGTGSVVSLFYSENPDVSRGHGHYVAVRREIYSTDVYVSRPDIDAISGILEDGVFYYSAHRHDYVTTVGGQFIDGGVYYTRSSGKTVTMILDPKGPRIERNGDVPRTETGEAPEGRLPTGETQAEEAASNV